MFSFWSFLKVEIPVPFPEITKTSGADRDSLMESYNALTARRSTVTAGNRDNILALLDDVRTLTRKVADLQMKHKMSV